jgi:hypothetical protein
MPVTAPTAVMAPQHGANTRRRHADPELAELTLQTLVALPRILPPAAAADRGCAAGSILRVTMARCQRSNVSGVTRNDRHADRGSARYSMRFTWRRSTAT